jgi:hypothetical protein
MRTGSKLSLFLIISAFFLVFGSVLYGVYYLGKLNVNGNAQVKDVREKVEDVLGSVNNDGIAKDPINSEEDVMEEKDPYMGMSVEQILTKLFSLKYEKPEEEIIVGISDRTDIYAMGGVSFKGEISGGWFLAANLDGEWEIVQDGNGTIICQIIEPYDFPGDMVPTCYDQEKMVVIARTGPDAPKPVEPEDSVNEKMEQEPEPEPDETLEEENQEIKVE